MIPQTIGRMVWLWRDGPPKDDREQPCAAQIAFVHSESRINVGYLDPNGEHKSATSVLLVGAGQEPPAHGMYATWMPYQIGQARAASAQ